MASAIITGTGSYTPEKVLTNKDLEKFVDTNDEWIVSRTGIKERCIAADDQATSDLAAIAAQRALENAGIKAEALDFILIGTASPDMMFPSTACLVQDLIGAKNAFCMDLNAACSGFVYSLEVARHFIEGGRYKTGLVIGSEKISTFVNWEDRTTCVLFGDGAGAAVLQAGEAGEGISDCILGSDGSVSDLLHIPAGGSRKPPTQETVLNKEQSIHMSGKEVFKHAVTNMTEAATRIIERAGLSVDDLDLVIPHQANIRIISAIQQKLNLPDEKLFTNVEKYGNTSAASVILAMDEASRSGKLKKGDKVLLVAFGAGFTWGATLLTWSRS